MNMTPELFVNTDTFIDQTHLINKLFKEDIIDIAEDIDSGDIYNKDSDEKEDICSWFLVDEWMAQTLLFYGESVIINHYGSWWGRRDLGQPIAQDKVIKNIVNDINKHREVV